MRFIFSFIALFIWILLVLIVLDFAYSLYSKIKYTVTGRKMFQPKCYDVPNHNIDMMEVKENIQPLPAFDHKKKVGKKNVKKVTS